MYEIDNLDRKSMPSFTTGYGSNDYWEGGDTLYKGLSFDLMCFQSRIQYLMIPNG